MNIDKTKFDSITYIKISFFILLFISIISLIKGWNTGNFSFSKIEIEWYFHFWLGLAALIMCTILAILTKNIYKKTNLITLRLIPISLILYAIGIAITTFHNDYCKICADLGICGSAHNYPIIIGLLIIYLLIIFHILYDKDLDKSLKNTILKNIMLSTSIIFFLMLIVLFIGIFFIKLPSEMVYKEKTNIQGLSFLSIMIFCFLVSIQYLSHFKKKKKREILINSISFFSLGLIQIIPAYHIFTCYWCDVEECSEFFSIGGIFIFISVYILWLSFLPLIEEK